MRILVISDTHNQHDQLVLPDADMIIHCGDATNKSSFAELLSFSEWFKNLPYKYKIFVPGNHDWFCFSNGYYLVKQWLSPDVHFLIADYIEIEGLKIFGSAKEGYEKCPEDIDILITHEPPNAILDELPPFSRFNNEPLPLFMGDLNLLNEVIERIRPKYHLFGHIHECNGQQEIFKNIHFINGAVLDEYYKLVRPNGITINL